MVNDFEFYDNNSIIVFDNIRRQIKKYNFKNKTNKDEEYEEIYDINFEKIINCNDYYYLVYNENNQKYLYNDEFKKIYEFKIELSKSPLIIRNELNENKSILFNILDINNKEVKLLTFIDEYKKKEEQFIEENKEEENKEENREEEKSEEEESEESIFSLDDNEEENLNEYYFKDCPPIFLNILTILEYKNNIIIEGENKKYINIVEIGENEEKNLINLKRYVEEEIKKEKKFNDINEEYLYYIKLLVKYKQNIIEKLFKLFTEY